MENIDKIIMQMISFGGEGKSLSYHALQLAEEGNMEEAEHTLKKAHDAIEKGRKAHMEILCCEANHSDEFKVSALLLHAADHVSNSEDVYELVKHMIKLISKEEKEKC